MADWRAFGWWDLPGPSRFLRRAIASVTGAAEGVAGLALPSRRPDGLLDALTEQLGQAVSVVIPVNAAAGLKARSPTSLLAAAAGVRTTGVRSASEFLAHPELADTVFLVDGITADEWYSWAYFLKFLRSERARHDRVLAPSILIMVPPHVPPDDAHAALGRQLRWTGQVSRHDTQTYMERLLGWPDDTLLARTAVSVGVELAGWDPAMARLLAGWGMDELVDPADLLQALPDVIGREMPRWDNGLVDRWDGVAWVHTAALVSAGDMETELKARLWRGQVRAVFPFLDQVRKAFTDKYYLNIRPQLPIEKKYHSRIKIYRNPWELELFDVNELIKADLPPAEADLMAACIQLRRKMAHYDAAPGDLIKEASDAWEDLAWAFPDDCPGWEWPRCGQKLVVLIGPSGAGKTTWAKRHYDPADVVSSDVIREKIFGGHDVGGDQEPVFRRLRAEVVARLSAGRSAVIDATNLRREDRLANVRAVPSDIPVEYVVIDRPMLEKVATAGWGAEKAGLIETHAALFESGLSDILQGDNLKNVSIMDIRQSAEKALASN